MNTVHTKSARECQLVSCLYCHNVSDITSKRCPHCSAPLESRKNKSNSRTWALLLTSIIIYFPANLYPILYTKTLASVFSGDTIISSIIVMWLHGAYLVATVIFLASIFTPFIKIFILLHLLIHQHPKKPPYIQTKLYHFIHFIGRWSMIDVFVVSLLSALINSKYAIMVPGLGIFAFCGVVIITMIATEAFDIRILWDNYRYYEHNNKHKN